MKFVEFSSARYKTANLMCLLFFSFFLLMNTGFMFMSSTALGRLTHAAAAIFLFYVIATDYFPQVRYAKLMPIFAEMTDTEPAKIEATITPKPTDLDEFAKVNEQRQKLEETNNNFCNTLGKRYGYDPTKHHFLYEPEDGTFKVFKRPDYEVSVDNNQVD